MPPSGVRYAKTGSCPNYDSGVRIYEYSIVPQDGDEPPNGLRLIATDEMPVYGRSKLTLVDNDGISLNIRLGTVLTVGRVHRTVEYFGESDTGYALRACAYHLEPLARCYADHIRLAEVVVRIRKGRGKGGALVVATDDDRVYFEIDAGVTLPR